VGAGGPNALAAHAIPWVQAAVGLHPRPWLLGVLFLHWLTPRFDEKGLRLHNTGAVEPGASIEVAKSGLQVSWLESGMDPPAVGAGDGLVPHHEAHHRTMSNPT